MKVTMRYGATLSQKGASPAVRKLLWINEDPTSDFAAQTVSLNLADYDTVTIYYVAAAGAQNYYMTGTPVDGTASLDAWTSIGTSGQAILHRHRTAAVDSSGVVFSACEQKRTNSTSASTSDNSGCIPVLIYGER